MTPRLAVIIKLKPIFLTKFYADLPNNISRLFELLKLFNSSQFNSRQIAKHLQWNGHLAQIAALYMSD